MAILFAVGAVTLPTVSFSPAPVTATGLRTALPVRSAATGRQFRTRTSATTRGASASIRAATTRATTTAATGSVFALSKGSPNSERT